MVVILVGSIDFLDVIKGEFVPKHTSSKMSFFDISQFFLGEAWTGQEHVPTLCGSLLHTPKPPQLPYRAKHCFA